MQLRSGFAALAAMLRAERAAAPAGAAVADQGSRQHRRRAPEPADRLRPRGRPQRHRRHAQQHPVHPAVAAGDAGAARRQHPRPDAAHRQRRRRDGDRQPARLRHPGHAHRRHRLGARRLPRACRAARCWSRRCSAPTATSMRSAQGSLAIGGFQAEGDAAKIVARRADRRPHRQRRHRRARDRLRAQPPANQVRLALRNPDFTTAKRIAAAINDFIGTPTAEPLDPSTVQLTVPKEYRRQRRRAADRDRAAADRARPAGQDRDRRALRHHRDGPRRARLHGRGRAGQSHGHDHRDAAGQPAGAVLARPDHAPCRAPSVGVQEDGKKLALVREGVSLQQLVDGLNALGIGPRDMISILQAIKAAGAIQADIEVM